MFIADDTGNTVWRVTYEAPSDEGEAMSGEEMPISPDDAADDATETEAEN